MQTFLWSRAAIWVLAASTLVVGSESLNPQRGRWDTPRLHELGAALDVLARWDSNWFLMIAQDGYSWPSATPAFFPLYPLLTGAAGRILLGHYILGGIAVSLVAGAIAFVLLHRLAREKLGEAGARRTVLLLALTPMSFYLGAVYSESLFLALAVGCFVLAERGRIAAAAAVAGLALLTRAQGAALLPALAAFAWRQPDRGRSLGLVAIAPGLFALYPLVLWAWVGRPLAFLDAEGEWGRSLSPAGPLGGLLRAIAERDLIPLAFAAAALPLAAVAWKRFGAPYGLYAAGVLAIVMSVPSARLGGLYSFPRLSLVAFPCFMALAWLAGRRPLLHGAIAVASAAVLAVFVVRWSLWYWVS